MAVQLVQRDAEEDLLGRDAHRRAEISNRSAAQAGGKQNVRHTATTRTLTRKHRGELHRRILSLLTCSLVLVMCLPCSFTLDRRDFSSDREYNDYLESSADIIYLLTYGSKVDAAAARTKLAEFARLNRAAIDKSKSRRFQEERDAERMARRGNMTAEERAAMAQSQAATAAAAAAAANQLGGSGMSFTLPQLDESGAAPPSSVEEEKRIHSISNPSERRRAMWALEEVRRIAGGFKREDDAKRCRHDAMDGLWM